MIVTPAKMPTPSRIARAAIYECMIQNVEEFNIDDEEMIASIYDRYMILYPHLKHAEKKRWAQAIARSISQSPYFKRWQERRPGGVGRYYYRSRFELTLDGLGGDSVWSILNNNPDYVDRCAEIYRLSMNLDAIQLSNPDHMLGIWQLVHNMWEPKDARLTRKQARREIAAYLKGGK